MKNNNQWVWIIVAICAVLLISLFGFAGMGGYGMMLPQGNYQMFGAGFSQLPTELGGQQPGAQGSRMSGHGME